MQQPPRSISSLELGPPRLHSDEALARAGGAPRAGWPAKEHLDYHKTLIELVLLVLAGLWVIKALFTKGPGHVIDAAGRKHLNPK